MTKIPPNSQTPEQQSPVGKLIRFCLINRLVVLLGTMAIIIAGIIVAPFDWHVGGLQRYPVPVDAIPDIGENQQIVFTQWPGRSPQDIDDQITYPLTVRLQGIPGVKTIRSYSMFGFSTIYIIFKEDAEFYWSRTRVLEKINSLPPDSLPPSVKPTLGPDATALGQIYWYTLEGRDPDGHPTGGWDQEELRTTQDWYVRYWLQAADGVADVGSIGGFVREYQVDVDPDALRAYGVNVDDVFRAVQSANIDVGAGNIEVNRAEYVIRGIGFIKTMDDIENSVIRVNADDVPVLVKHVATVHLGPAGRRGALDKGGAPAVGGVVIARYGDNPLRVISNVKEVIQNTRDSLPSKAVIDYAQTTHHNVNAFATAHGFTAFSGGILNQQDWLSWLRATPRDTWPSWITLSQVTIVPFYDRTGLIYETLGTLNTAIGQEILVTIIVVLVIVMHLRSSAVISSLLPLTVLLCFVGMKLFNIQANIVALSGIAIAIGTIVDMGIVICENILKHLNEADTAEPRLEIIHRAASEVGGAVLTAVLTTIVSFLPVFTMIGPEGKLFKPLAYTKTFALLASITIALTLLPTAAHLLFRKPVNPKSTPAWRPHLITATAIAAVTWLLTANWEPLGPENGMLRNLIFVTLLLGSLLAIFKLFQYFYPLILAWCLDHKAAFLCLPTLLLLTGLTIWLGTGTTLGWLPENLRKSTPVRKLTTIMPGLSKEFMPDLDEGSFLFMPTTMPHASIGEALDILQKQDLAFQAIPEIESVVGKLGRADTPLDPAPISMIETVINYKSEYRTDKKGRRLTFRYTNGQFERNSGGELIQDPAGRPYRQWRDHIRTPDDIWHEITEAARLPGTTSAPKLQPIAARIVMLQSGIRAPMGIKIKGPNLKSIETIGLQLETYLKQVPEVEPATVIADRIIGKPYLEIIPNRKALARYGIPIRKFQDTIESAIGGKLVTHTVEGRERFPVRVRYNRELRDNIEALANVLIPGMKNRQIPISELAEIRYVRGPQVIKSEDTFLVGYVVFDKKPGLAEVDVVEQCQAFLQHKLDSGDFTLPSGVSFTFAGNYQNQIRASKTLSLVLPIALFIIFMIIYLQFRSTITTMLIFSGVFIAWSGGFLLIWLYGQPWFLNFEIFGTSMRALFQMEPINLSVAVWVGFLALFGIATDDGVIMGTYLTQRFRNLRPTSKQQIRANVIQAGTRRVRACLMTTATTILALLPVLTSTGKGSDIMVPMAIPSFGGMLIEITTMLVVPVLYCLIQEMKHTHSKRQTASQSSAGL